MHCRCGSSRACARARGRCPACRMRSCFGQASTRCSGFGTSPAAMATRKADRRRHRPFRNFGLTSSQRPAIRARKSRLPALPGNRSRWGSRNRCRPMPMNGCDRISHAGCATKRRPREYRPDGPASPSRSSVDPPPLPASYRMRRTACCRSTFHLRWSRQKERESCGRIASPSPRPISFHRSPWNRQGCCSCRAADRRRQSRW